MNKRKNIIDEMDNNALALVTNTASKSTISEDKTITEQSERCKFLKRVFGDDKKEVRIPLNQMFTCGRYSIDTIMYASYQLNEAIWTSMIHDTISALRKKGLDLFLIKLISFWLLQLKHYANRNCSENDPEFYSPPNFEYVDERPASFKDYPQFRFPSTKYVKNLCVWFDGAILDDKYNTCYIHVTTAASHHVYDVRDFEVVDNWQKFFYECADVYKPVYPPVSEDKNQNGATNDDVKRQAPHVHQEPYILPIPRAPVEHERIHREFQDSTVDVMDRGLTRPTIENQTQQAPSEQTQQEPFGQSLREPTGQSQQQTYEQSQQPVNI